MHTLKGHTPIHLAALCGSIDCLKLLHQAGANLVMQVASNDGAGITITSSHCQYLGRKIRAYCTALCSRKK